MSMIDQEMQADKPFSPKILQIAEKLKSDEIRVVSFDIFDTLLLRPVMQPTELFSLLGAKLGIRHFRDKRVTAEASTRRFLSPAWDDVTLDEIYDQFGRLFGYTDEECESIKREELAIEYQVLYPRKAVQFLFHSAREAGKEIIIVSDMYLPAEFLGRCLKKNGYDGFANLYVSSETRKSKGSGRMYDYVLHEMRVRGISANEILHIGDNERADIRVASSRGMQTIHIPKTTEVAKRSRRLSNCTGFLMTPSFDTHNSLVYGMLLNKYFDDPFIQFEKDSAFNGDATYLGYWMSPLIIGICKWLVEECERDKIEQFAFVWRDGYIPSKVFEILRPCITQRKLEVTPIYLGRTLRLPFLSLEKNGLFDSIVDYPIHPEVPISHVIESRLLCDDEKQFNEIVSIFFRNGYLSLDAPIRFISSYREFLNELEPYFIKNSQKKIELYSKYVRSLIHSNKKIGVFDRSSRGVSARFLSERFDINTSFYTTELYTVPLAELPGIKNGILKSYVKYGKKCNARTGWLWGIFFERIISDTTPGFRDIKERPDGSISLVFDNDEIEDLNSQTADNRAITNKTIETIQSGIVDFAKDFANVFDKYVPYIFIDSCGVFDQTLEILINPSMCDGNLILKISPDYSSVSTADKDIFEKWYNGKMKGKRPKSIIPKGTSNKDRFLIWGYHVAEKVGMLEPALRVYHKYFRKDSPSVLTYDKVAADTDLRIEQAKAIAQFFDTSNCILFIGIPQQSAFHYINVLADKMPEYSFAVNTSDINCSKKRSKVLTFGWPPLFGLHTADGKTVEKCKNEEKTGQSQYDLHRTTDVLCAVGSDKTFSKWIADEQAKYYEAVFKMLNPKAVIVWNSVALNSGAASVVARGCGIPVIYMESGHLEGTFIFSTALYGEDKINQEPKSFINLPVNSDELNYARNTLDYLAESRLNRYMQAEKSCDLLKNKLIKDRKTVLLVGQYDIDNPPCRYDEHSWSQYCPTFNKSAETLDYLSRMARKNHWNLVYKPHPLNIRENIERKPPRNVIVADNDINELIDLADVVVCMLSGVAYIALSRGRPLVELSYTPLREKGCCYEAFTVDSIEGAIRQALEDGYTQEQREAFVKHVAQMNKYYFFDNLTHPEMPFGRPIEEAVDVLRSVIQKADA